MDTLLISKVDRGIGRGTVYIVLASTQQLHITQILDIECDNKIHNGHAFMISMNESKIYISVHIQFMPCNNIEGGGDNVVYKKGCVKVSKI